jgi:hypothetical protein
MSSPPRPSVLDLRPLGHPLWWLAVAVLFINDNLLKGGGVAPGWLTGKLSGFAFLVVAPVLLGCLLPVGLRRRKELALAAVAGLYVATELSAAAADGVVAVAAWLGMNWRLWPDLTDLLALAVLPLSWRLLARPVPGARPLRPIGVIVGLHLCLATTDIKEFQFPFFVNRSSGPVEMRLTRPQVNACTADLKALAATLSLGDLGAPEEFTLERGEVAALDREVPEGGSARRCLAEFTSVQGECTTVLVEVKGGPAVLMRAARGWADHATGGFFCSSEPESSHCRHPRMDPSHDPGPGALSLVGSPGKLAFRAAPQLEIVEVSRAAIEARGVPPESCEGLKRRLDAFLATTAQCRIDADCQPAWLHATLIRPGAPCFVHTDAPGVALLTDLNQKASARCAAPSGPPRCEGLPPSACRAGRCEQACPGQPCAHPCRPGEAQLLDCAKEGDLCALNETRICKCQGKLWMCGDRASLGGCVVACLDPFAAPSTPDAGGASADTGND